MIDIKTGVLSFSSIDYDMLDILIQNGVDLNWEEAIKGMTEEEVEDLSESWESLDSVYLYGFKQNDKGDYEEDISQDFSVIISIENGGNVQILHSSYVVSGIGLCSLCYPDQGDLESEGSLTAYILPPEYLNITYDISKIRVVLNK